jgi:flavorubredoxin
VSHHHPDHAGGLNAFVDIGASIITTPGNQAFFNKLLNATHTLKAENGMKAKPASFKMVPPKTAFNLTDPSNSVKIIEAGEGTDHVKEFLFFYFPQQKLLFVGDLVLFPEEGVMDQSQRALSVHNLIKTQQLNVEKIYTSWPLHNQKTYGSMEDLKASLAKNYPDLNK